MTNRSDDTNFDSAFGSNVTDLRIFHVLTNNEFKFEKYIQRDGPWARHAKGGKAFYIILTICTGFIMLLYIPLVIYIYHLTDKVLVLFFL